MQKDFSVTGFASVESVTFWIVQIFSQKSYPSKPEQKNIYRF